MVTARKLVRAGPSRAMPRAVEPIAVHFFVFFVKNEEKIPSARHFGGTACGIAREGPARTSFRAVTTSRDHPPYSCTRFGPPRVRQNTQKQGCGVLLGHMQTVRRKYSCVQVIESSVCAYQITVMNIHTIA